MALEEIEDVIMEGTNEGSEINNDFYETIQAPKFVDLAAPDHRPMGDDRYWFCARVGCDQKHDEEMDSEVIYKDFVLRVMAARSPSVRLRKAFCRNDKSIHPKCPNTAPTKPSRSRVSRLAMISSIPQKTTDKAGFKVRQNSTPKVKGQGKDSSVEAKAFTLPCKQKKLVSDPGSFRSVRNPRTAAIRASKNRIVAKALVFHSPKKTVKLKRCVEQSSCMKKICEGMKKLEIANKRRVLECNPKLVPSDSSRKPMKGREIKSRVFDFSHSKEENSDKVKSLGTMKKRVKEKGEALVGNKSKLLLKTLKCEENKSNFEENDSGMKQESRSEEMNDLSATDENSDMQKAKKHEDKENEIATVCNEKANVMAADVNTYENREKGVESDDKENNASASDNNWKIDEIQRKAFGKNEICITPQRVTMTEDKCSNGKATSASTRAAAKYTKPKPTNPKPFRLRTDERQILKEANTEKKHSHHTPLKETTTMIGPKHDFIAQRQENRRIAHDKAYRGTIENVEKMKKPLVRKQNAVSKDVTVSSGRKTRTTTYMNTTPRKGLVTSQMCLEEKRTPTIPRGPKFHSIHVPKSCTKRLIS